MAEPVFQGLEIELHSFSGARALCVVHPGAQQIAEHRHDRAYIGIHTTGRYRERFDGGDLMMDGPCAVLHPAGRPHADEVGDSGLETLTIEFDPTWLEVHGYCGRLDRSIAWSGGPASLAAGKLAKALRRPPATEADLASATITFLHAASAAPVVEPPVWIDRIRTALGAARPSSTRDLARDLDLNPAWLARAYRYFAGEGLADTARRRRVEAATLLLRRTDLPLADVALEAGFCDQSHMNRCFNAVLGRTPVRVRQERPFSGTDQAIG